MTDEEIWRIRNAMVQMLVGQWPEAPPTTPFTGYETPAIAPVYAPPGQIVAPKKAMRFVGRCSCCKYLFDQGGAEQFLFDRPCPRCRRGLVQREEVRDQRQPTPRERQAKLWGFEK